MTTDAVGLIIFNRADLTVQVLERIRQAKPRRLIVVADGPRHAAEERACAEARAVIDTVDWDCELIREFSDDNLGCQRRIETGLTAIFDAAESAIILEDDCLPHPYFFDYCTELLDRYRDDESVGIISGDNSMRMPVPDNWSYTFASYGMIWGWAAWSRVWRRHDPDMALWPIAKSTRLLDRRMRSARAQSYWTTILDKQYDKGHNTWDYGLTFSCWANGFKAIVPRDNMITNIGFRPDATHTKGYHDPRANMRGVQPALPLVHPTSRSTRLADQFIERHVFSGDRAAYGDVFRGVTYDRVLCSFGAYLETLGHEPGWVAGVLTAAHANRASIGGFHMLDAESCAAALSVLQMSDTFEQDVEAVAAQCRPPAIVRTRTQAGADDIAPAPLDDVAEGAPPNQSEIAEPVDFEEHPASLDEEDQPDRSDRVAGVDGELCLDQT